jgi:hypothetical protein
VTEKHNRLILTIDLEEFDKILKKIHDISKKGDSKIKIDIPITITSKGLNTNILKEFQLIKDDFESLSYTPLEPPHSKDVSRIKDTLLQIVKRTKMNFEDFRDRQLNFFQLKQALKLAKTDFQGDQHLEVIICLFDAVKNSYAENLSIEQVNVIEAVINEIDHELTDVDVDNITEKLITAGFNPLPSLDGLAEIYQRQGEL